MLYKNKFILGTAQFGNAYGVSNIKKKKIKKNEIFKILKYCNQQNIKFIDTSYNYGPSQKLVGQLNNKFEICTKISLTNYSQKKLGKFINTKINFCLKDLKKNKLNTLFIHNFDKIFSNKKFIKKIYLVLNELKKKKIFKKIGISSYYPEKLHNYHRIFKFDVVQVPFNIFDQRLLHSKFFKQKKYKKIQIQVRSIFLQGLLLMDKKNLPKYFFKWNSYFNYYFNYLNRNKITALKASLRFIKQFNRVNFIVIGVQNYLELKQILVEYKKLKKIKNKFRFINDEKLINPSLWKKIYE